MSWRGPCVCVYVMRIITAKTAEPIDMPCHLARIILHNHVLHEGPDPPGTGQFWVWANKGLQRGMNLWGDGVAFCQITLTSCIICRIFWYWHALICFSECLKEVTSTVDKEWNAVLSACKHHSNDNLCTATALRPSISEQMAALFQLNRQLQVKYPLKYALRNNM